VKGDPGFGAFWGLEFTGSGQVVKKLRIVKNIKLPAKLGVFVVFNLPSRKVVTRNLDFSNYIRV
jgi:hypothetical protein